MSIQEKQKQIVKSFAHFEDWTDRYKKIISMGKELNPLAEEFKTEQNRVKGCQSLTWLHAKLEGDKIIYQADSDAVIVKGLAAILIQVFSVATPQEIIEAKTDFLQEIGLTSHLSQSRSNGMASMVKQFKHFAIAFNVLLQSR
ncbi:Fe-S metabolism protein SufE [bacterium K02(2017)]|nr:Fe-S metabolism protein SufE [bacterium K02(2017)]